MRRLSVIVLGILLSVGAFAADHYPFKDPRKQMQFNELTHTFRCLVCQNEDLAASQATLAMRLKDELYEMVNKDMTTPQIKQYMVQRYGDFVMLKPPLAPRTALLWFLPVLLLLGGVLILWRMHRRGGR